MSEARITKKDIEHLKKLARVEFGEKKTEELAGDLERIIGYIEMLKEVDVSNVSEMTHVGGERNIFRADKNPIEFNETMLGKLISAFPEKEKTYLKVKAVLKK
ncbi:MAG: Asp-tRNA(Asn)/Glu-tRNA(Gln) amidotransferase subunit GatC [Patescibacteria group bacterium]